VNSTTDRRASSFGLVALAIGAAPRTASNNLYHRLMLAAIAVSFLLCWSVVRVRDCSFERSGFERMTFSL
jgi:hypothetical protein